VAAALTARLPVVYPIILGHEGAGTVERVGRDVSKVRPGDRVLFTPDYCGRCQQCVLGLTPYCDEVVAVTFTGTRADGSPRAHQDGRPVRASFFGQSSFASHALVTERNIVPVPADAPLHYLAGFTCGVQTGAGAILLITRRLTCQASVVPACLTCAATRSSPRVVVSHDPLTP
jgi:aryl-alcohol dehydrogenase